MIINLRNINATPSQAKYYGVVELPAFEAKAVRAMLVFKDLPRAGEIAERSERIADFAVKNGLGEPDGDDPLPDAALIGGPLYLMASLEKALAVRGITPMYAWGHVLIEAAHPTTTPCGIATRMKHENKTAGRA